MLDTLFNSLSGSNESDGSNEDMKSKQGSQIDTSTSNGSSTNFLDGILNAFNSTSCDSKEGVEVGVSELSNAPPSSSRSLLWSSGGSSPEKNSVSEPPPIPPASSSFFSRLSSVGSSPEESNDGAKEGQSSKSDSKWRTSSIRESGETAKSDRPSVYEESQEMIIAALLIYTFADLRKMARDGKIPSNDLTKHPITINHVMDAIQTHGEALDNEAKIDQDDLEARLKALKHIQKQQKSSSTLVGRMLRGSAKKKETVLTHFHDEKCTQGMVYGIAVNHIRKRVTVVFRGSQTQQDFVQDVKVAQKEVNNPAAKVAMETPTTINIHTGFYEYLFKKDDSGRVRLEHILDDVKVLMKKYKGYSMYCTGHSLGGALASLCGFYAAADPKITKHGPVVVVSIASPRVGNDEFRTAFRDLERLRLLQHLRVSNKEDVVTLLPFVAMKEASFSPMMFSPTSHSVNLYKHCGIHLKFKSGDPEKCGDERQLFSVTFAKDKNDDEGTLPEELKRSVVAAKSLVGSLFATKLMADFKQVINFHCCDEYERRLENSKKYLDNITLDQLYADQCLVGRVVANPVQAETNTSSRSIFGSRKSSRGLKA